MLWMYQMAENKAVTGAVPQEYSFSHYFPADGKCRGVPVKKLELVILMDMAT
jgi:hypothetical protein